MKSKKLFFTLFVAVFMAAALLFLFVGNVAKGPPCALCD